MRTFEEVAVSRGAEEQAEIPLPEKAALSYREVEALGYCKERTLRKLVATGKVRRAVLRVGRSVRFLRDVLIDELRRG